MPMNRQDVLNAIIDDGVTEIPMAYHRPDQVDKRLGATEGLESCRMLDDAALVQHHEQARERTTAAMRARAADYWYHRMYEVQVEWVMNVLSAAKHAHGLPTLTAPTVRGMNKAVDILGTNGPMN